MNKLNLRPDQAVLLQKSKEKLDAMAAGYAAGTRDALSVVLQIIAAIPESPKQEAVPDGNSTDNS